MSVILAVWEYQGGGTPMDDERWLAYMLATVYHETATRIWPIEEYGKGAGHEYGQGRPGNRPGLLRARFRRSLTWRDNYAKGLATILASSTTATSNGIRSMALDSLIATRVLFRGMAEGWFTGRKLGQYFNETPKTIPSTPGRSSTATTTTS